MGGISAIESRRAEAADIAGAAGAFETVNHYDLAGGRAIVTLRFQ